MKVSGKKIAAFSYIEKVNDYTKFFVNKLKKNIIVKL